MRIYVLHISKLARYNRTFFFVVMFILVTTTTFAQQCQYCPDEFPSNNLSVSTTKKYITFDRTIIDTTTLKQVLSLPNAVIQGFGELSILNDLDSIITSITTEDNWAIVEDADIENIVLTNHNLILSECPVYITANNEELVISHLFYVNLNNSTDFQLLENLAQQNNIELLGNNKFMPLWYTLSCNKNSTDNTLQMANLFHQTGLFASVQPDFLVKIETTCVNDPLFPNQWGLENTGQAGGIAGIDINLCQAHQITTGNNNVVVAVIDGNGVEKTHLDLTNIHSASYDISSGTSPSQIGPGSEHATPVAGIIGANRNNNEGLTGISPDCPIMTIGMGGLASPGMGQKIANGVNFAWQNGASVINNSWYISNPTEAFCVLNNAFCNAMTLGRNGLGTVVVFASANDNNPTVSYPANFHPDIIAVGAISPCGERWSTTSCISPASSGGSNYGEQLDVVAPGVLIPTTNLGNSYSNFSATSSAAPHVAGIAALILSVNPCLTQRQVGDIIEATTQKVRPDLYNYQTTFERSNGVWHTEMGYGLVNANEAVKAAQASYSTTLDLYSKDTYNDFGVEPNIDNGPLWISKDIWVRVNNDGIQNQQTESIEYRTGEPVYVYVRVRNRSCEPSLGTETLTLNWAKASTGLSWPTDWDGSVVVAGQPYSGLVGNLTIPLIDAGNETILTFTWTPPNPDVFQAAFGTDYKHFCLLSRIQTSSTAPYGMTYPEGSNIYTNTKNNNNIVWKNVQINNDIPGIVSPGGTGVGNGAVIVRNVETIPVKIKLGFKVPVEELGNSIFDKGTIKVNIGTDLFDKWNAGGRVGNGVALAYELRFSSPRELDPIIAGIDISVPVLVPILTITNPNAYIGNINLAGREEHTISMEFYQDIALPAEGKNQFNYDVVQYNTNGTEEITGGERYIINALVEQTVYGTTLRKVNTTEQLTSIEDLSGNKIAIYPNPTQSILTIEINNEKLGYIVRITDLFGREVFKDKLVNKIKIDVSSIPKGIYFIEIIDTIKNIKQIKKVIVN